MQPKSTAPKIHQAPEVVESTPLAVVPKSSVVPMAINAFLALVVLGMVVLTLFLQQKVWTAQQEVTRQATQFATEMEQLRVDVVTTSSENVVYLKVMLLKPGIDKQLARDIAHSVVLRSREHKRDPDLTLALIAVESNFNPNAVSSTGAMGLTQIMPFWKKAFGIDRDLHDVDTSIKYGLDILGSYEQIFGGIELALTAYNRGPNAVSNDMRDGKVPYNGYAESVMKTYSRVKTWTRP
jgi:soluble lytic murein transglycosylase-like protein